MTKEDVAEKILKAVNFIERKLTAEEYDKIDEEINALLEVAEVDLYKIT
jgi:hypothetical protein